LEDPSSTLDPALSEAAQKEQAARERAEAMAAAAAVVATIAPAAGAEKAKARRVGKKDPERKGIKTSKRPYRDPFTKDKNKYRYADKSAEGSGTNSEEPPDEAAQKAEEKKRPRRRAPTKKRTSAEIDAENEENALNEPNGEEGAPPKKRARAKNGEGGSKRTAKAEKNDKESSVTVERFVLGDVNPGEMFGEEPEPEALTMAALATKAIGGKVSERGIILDKFNQTMEEQRRAESARRRKERWQNGQLYRRKLRAENNENRAARREDARAQGLDPLDIVSEDSEDSEEEFEIAPDRMTPPAEDEREPRREPLRIGPPTQSAPREVGRFAVSGTAGAGDDDEEVDENDPDAMLRAAGFTVEAGAEGGEMEDGEQADGENGGENEDEDEDAEEPDWGAMDMDAYAYHQDIEDRRRQIIEGTDSREVIEEDDETKMINSGTYGKIAKIERWTAKETEMFYVVSKSTLWYVERLTAIRSCRRLGRIPN
jgi:transcription factor TFIIIB component B''